eukprot:m.670651 g.670651  ORF g.670651 m.670651 type:complete len:77 (-) comp22767_c0_seq1:1317-1547(-)
MNRRSEGRVHWAGLCNGLCNPGTGASGAGDLPMLEMVDMVQLPAGLVPGSYVLGWRWDCEESTQVWTSCSDVTITA